MLTWWCSTNTAFAIPCAVSHFQSGVEGRINLADVAAVPSGYIVGKLTHSVTLAPVPASAYSRLTAEPDGVCELVGVLEVVVVTAGVGVAVAVPDAEGDVDGEAPCDSVADADAVAEGVGEGSPPTNTARLMGSLTAASSSPGPVAHGLAGKALPKPTRPMAL